MKILIYLYFIIISLFFLFINNLRNRMIGPSETAGKATESQCCLSSKRKIFDELDIDSCCEEIPLTNHKRCFQELDSRPVELITASNEILTNATALFSPMSGQEIVEETPVTRLEVLLVDGTNCTWTTVSELEQQQNLDVLVGSSSSSLISPSACTNHYATETYIVEETKHQSSKNHLEPVTAPALLLTNSNVQQYKNHTVNNYQQHQLQQQQQQFEDQENGNLSWLLDFKLDSFIEAADRPAVGSVMTKDNHCGENKVHSG